MKFISLGALILLAACSAPNKYAKYIEKPAITLPIINKEEYIKEFDENVGDYSFEQSAEETFVSPDEFFGTLVSEVEYSDKQRQLIDTGLNYIGTPYVFGGTTPDQGFDCSGFTQYVYKNAIDQNLPRTARQMANIGLPVDGEHLKPGDLVFFNTMGATFSHVGIYIGEGKFFHASPRYNQITIGDMNSKYFLTRFTGARRVLG